MRASLMSVSVYVSVSVSWNSSLVKQYSSVPVAGQQRPAAGKVTVGLASHWPCVTDFCGSSSYGLKADKADREVTMNKNE